MRNRFFHRIRRATVASMAGVAAIGVLAVAGGVLGTASSAAASPVGCPPAADTPTCGTITSASAPTMQVGSVAQAAGSIAINLVGGSTWAVGDYIQLEVTDHTGGTTVSFSGTPTVTAGTPSSNVPGVKGLLDDSGLTFTTLGTPHAVPGAAPCTPNTTAETPSGSWAQRCNTLDIWFTNNGTAPAGGVTINVTSVSYDVGIDAANGPVTIAEADAFTGNTPSATYLDTTPPPGPDFFTGGGSNAVIFFIPLAAQLVASDTPIVSLGNQDQHAGDWGLLVGNAPGFPPSGWQVGEKFVIQIADHNGANCTATGDDIGFNGPLSGIQVAAFSNSAEVTAVPTFTTAFASSTACATAGVADELVLTTTNSGQIPGYYPFVPITVGIFGVTYSVGTKAGLGAIDVSLSTPGGGAPFSHQAAPGGPSNAYVSNITMTTNTPAVDLFPNTINGAISPITISELPTPETFPAVGTSQWVCVTLKDSTGAHWFASGAPTLTVTSGDATVSGLQGQGTRTLYFDVTSASETDPSVFQLAGLSVTTAPQYTGPVTVYISAGPVLDLSHQHAECGSDTDDPTSSVEDGTFAEQQLTEQTQAFAVVETNRIAGSDADATSAAEFESQFPAATGAPDTTCPPNENAVLATDLDPWDALPGNYMAGNLQTGILLSGPGSPSTEALNALRVEGVTTVYRLGGPVVWGTGFDAALGSVQAYDCGGQVPRTNEDGSPVDIKVVDVYGATADSTAKAIAEFFGTEGVGEGNFGAAYCATLPYCEGSDMFNTSGGGASSPAEPTQTVSSAHHSPDCPASFESGNCWDTAIVTTDVTWQDAMSASPIAYWAHFPVIITPSGTLGPDAIAALQDDNIQQVIMMGGPVALSDTVEGDITAMGISVLRIAGPTYVGTSTETASFELDNSDTEPYDVVGLSILPEGLDWGSTFSNGLVVTRGDWWADAVAGGVVAGSGGGLSQVFNGQGCSTSDDNSEGDASVSLDGDGYGIGETAITGDDQCPEAMVLTQDPNTIGSALDTFLQANGARWFYWHAGSSTPIFALTFLGGTAAESTGNVASALTDIATQPQNP